MTNPKSLDGRPLRVLVVTPLGQGGAGGIDRVVDQLRTADAERENLALDFATSRGTNVVASLYNLPLTALRIATGALSGRLDVVHLNLSSNASAYRKLMLGLVCRLFGVPYVIHLHGSRFHKLWAGLSRPSKGAVDSFFAHAGAVMVLGEVWRELVVSHVPQAADRIFVVPNATQARPMAIGSGETPNIVFLGRLGERKGVPDLLRALAALPRAMPWTATIAGDGEVAEAKTEAGRLGIAERVDVPGWVSARDVESLIAKADILVLPSYDENLPMSVIEGMAAGLAVVATPVGATADVIRHGKTGLLVEPGDVDGLAAALGQLVGDPQLRRSLGEAAREFHARELDAQHYVDRLMVPWSFASKAGAVPVEGGTRPA
jgi:glycosyltransferase involved in cell wall biosynthesis